MSIIDNVREALVDRPRWVTFARISADTGLSPAWLSEFVHDKMNDYGVRKLERLGAYLSCVSYDPPSLIPVEKIGIIRAKDRVSAVYVLWDDDKPVYVGQTQNLRTRIITHRKNKTFTHVEAFYINGYHEKNAYERILIHKYRPKANVNHNPDYSIAVSDGGEREVVYLGSQDDLFKIK